MFIICNSQFSDQAISINLLLGHWRVLLNASGVEDLFNISPHTPFGHILCVSESIKHCCCPHPAFVNEAVLEHSHPRSLAHCLWLRFHLKSRAVQLKQSWTSKAKNIYCAVINGKRLLIPALEQGDSSKTPLVLYTHTTAPSGQLGFHCIMKKIRILFNSNILFYNT